MKSDLVPLGQIARTLPRSGQLMRDAEPKPPHPVSARAQGFWLKLCSMYGASKLQDYGDWPPVEVCKAIDALREVSHLKALLEEIKQRHQIWPPNVPQLEELTRKYIAPSIDWPKLRDDLTQHIMRAHYANMSQPQRIGIPRWNWYQDGVFVPPGDGAAGFFVPFTALGDT